MNDKDRQLIESICEHCCEISDTIKRFGADCQVFLADSDYFKSVSMSLMQIGELSHCLSDSFIDTYVLPVWKKSYGLRNIYAHQYGKIDKEIIWDAITRNIPDLHKLCNNILSGLLETVISDCRIRLDNTQKNADPDEYSPAYAREDIARFVKDKYPDVLADEDLNAILDGMDFELHVGD